MHKKGLVVGGVLGAVALTTLVLSGSGVFAEQNCETDANTGLLVCTDSETGAKTYQRSASATASVTVSAACSFSRTNGSGDYTGVLTNNNSVEVSGSTFRTICNDPGGYAVYAIGFSNDTLGNTDLIFNNTPESTYNIETNPEDSTASNWKMKVTVPSANNTAPNYINEAYDDVYGVIPASYTKIASLNTVTDAASASTINGSSISVAYQATASSTQPAGTYAGAVKYTMVRPNTNIPNQEQDCTSGYICYFLNAEDTIADTMGDQSIGASDTSAVLWASNFKRDGYGFAGWNTAYDGSGTSYGPNQTITFEVGQYSGNNDGLALYAMWVPVATNNSGGEITFQTSGLTGVTLADGETLSAKSNGYVTALRDIRDGQVYAVAKLADGNYWMIENLRLDAANSADSTKAQGFGTGFVGLANAESSNFSTSTTANSLYSTDDAYTMPRYNNINTANMAANMSSTDMNVYSYGNYYTWAAAIADIATQNSGSVTTSICPTGWHLPYGGSSTGASGGNTSGGFYYLGVQLGATVSSGVSSGVWRSYPNNFVYSGYFYDSARDNIGEGGDYWSSTAEDVSSAYGLFFADAFIDTGTTSFTKYYGQTVRCVYGS